MAVPAVSVACRSLNSVVFLKFTPKIFQVKPASRLTDAVLRCLYINTESEDSYV